jgi:two-component system, NarL family, sensor kinase
MDIDLAQENRLGVKFLLPVFRVLLSRGLAVWAFFAITPCIFSQIQTDSLKLERIGNAVALFNPRDTVMGMKYCHELDILSLSTSDSLIKQEADRLAGVLYGKMGFFDDAFRSLDYAIKFTNSIKDSRAEIVKAKALTNKGSLFHQNGDFNEALNCYFEAEKLYYVENNIPGLINIYSGMGDLYDKIAQPEKRKEFNERAFGLINQTTDTIAIVKAITGIATNLCNDGNFQEALKLYNRAVELSQKIKNKQLEHIAWYDIGFTYSRMDDFARAEEMYAKSYEVALFAGDRMNIGDALYKLGLVNFYSGNYQKSKERLFQAMEIAIAIGSKILERNIYDVLYSVEEAEGNYKKAYEYQNKYVDVKFEIFSEEDQRQVNFLKAKFDAEKREFQITKLKAEKEIQSLKLNKQRWFILSLSLPLLFALMFTIFILRQKRYKENLAEKQKLIQEQKISELEKERQLVAAKSVLQGEEKERTRIASDLHDGLGGLLSSIKINMSNMKKNACLSEEQVSSFNDAISLLDSSIKELRRIANNMAPETLYNYGLKTALYDYCVDVAPNGTPEISFSFFGSDLRFGSELELSFYRIGQELINNSLKHAKATQINVQLFAEEKRIALQVFDNGCGFDLTETKSCDKGHGIKNVRNRVAAFGGKFNIYGQRGEGTEILVEFEIS